MVGIGYWILDIGYWAWCVVRQVVEYLFRFIAMNGANSQQLTTRPASWPPAR
jgi:hypothetical protein